MQQGLVRHTMQTHTRPSQVSDILACFSIYVSPLAATALSADLLCCCTQQAEALYFSSGLYHLTLNCQITSARSQDVVLLLGHCRAKWKIWQHEHCALYVVAAPLPRTDVALQYKTLPQSRNQVCNKAV